jgi:hypothetical protein
MCRVLHTASTRTDSDLWQCTTCRRWFLSLVRFSNFIFSNSANRRLDFSIPPSMSRLVYGSLAQFLDPGRRGSSKPLQASGFPMPTGVNPPPHLLSHTVAWNYMLGTPWCSTRWELPHAALSSGSAWTVDAFSRLQFPPNGLSTYVEVKVGTLVAFVAHPRDGHPDGFVSMGLASTILMNPSFSAFHDVAWEAFPLEAGTSL